MKRTMILVDAFRNGAVLDTTNPAVVDLFKDDVDFCETHLADIQLEEGIYVLEDGTPTREASIREANFKEVHAYAHGKRPFGRHSVMLDRGTRNAIPN